MSLRMAWSPRPPHREARLMPRRKSQPRIVSCAKCGSEFETTHSQGKYCNEACARLGARDSWRAYGHRNSDHRKAYHRSHYEKNSEAIALKVAEYRKTPRGRNAQKVSDKRQRAKFPEKHAARQAVLVALRSGRLKRQPCKRCGHAPAQAHHPDYSKPLDVVWLCPDHHREADKEQRNNTRPEPVREAAE